MSIKKKTTILAALVIFAVFSIAAAALMSFDINITDAYEDQPFTITATASETNGTITAMTIEHFGQGDWQKQDCNTGSTCTKSWNFTEESAGNYTFRIKAKNSLGKIAIDSFMVEVKKPSVPPTPLKVDLGANPDNGEEPLDVRLRCKVDDSNKKPFSYVLDINGEIFFNTTDDEDTIRVNHVFNSGVYNVTCTVTDSEGMTGADSAIVNVTGQPVADLPPYVTLIAPADGAVLSINNVTAQFMAVDDVSEEINCSMYAMSDNGMEWQEVLTAFLMNATAISTTSENVPDGTYTWNVGCTDETGNSAFAAGNYTVTINSTPIIVPVQCADGIDNDNDGLIDLADPGCADANDDNETDEIPPVVDLAPVVTLIAPADGTILIDTNNVTAQYIVTDDITQNMSCSVAVVDADGNFQLVGNVHSTLNDTMTSVDFTNVPNGVYVWNVLCIDGLWNLGYNPANFTVTVNYTQSVLAQCADGIDNDGDGLIDVADPGCADANDDNETDEIVCQNNLEISGISIAGTDIFDGATVTMSRQGVSDMGYIPFDYNLTNLGLTEITGINQSMSMTSNTTGEATSSSHIIGTIGPQTSVIEGEDFNELIDPLIDGDYHMVLSVEGADENGCSQNADFDFILRLATLVVLPQCNDSIDNDGDGLIDYPADPGCTDANDDNETDEIVIIPPQCADGLDNDADGLIDLTDPGCTDANDDNETDEIIIIPPQCNDSIDNDADGLIDLADLGCIDANDDNETDEIITPPLDSIAPVVQIIAPQDGETITSSNVTVQYIAADETSANLTCAVFTINGTEVTQVSDAILTANNTITSIDFTNVPNGLYVWNVACIDEAWNLGMNPVNFTNIVNATDNNTNQTQNHAPVFDPIDNVIVSESHIVFITPAATDPDGDNVTITASNLPAGATFEMGALLWVPDYSQAGDYNITFTASDGQLDTSIDVLITVLDVLPEQQMSVTLVSDAVSGTAPLDVNFTCSVENGESPYSYAWIIYDESQLAFDIGFSWPVTDSNFSFNEVLGAGNWTASCIVGDSNGTVVTSNSLTIIIDTQPALTQCADGIDNDADGLVDMADPGCIDANDDNETDEIVVIPAQCADGLDNDADGLIDLADPGCTDANDDNETDEIVVIPPQCNDSIDNDADGLIDLADPGCIDANDDNETDAVVILPQCGDAMDNDGDGLIDLADPGCIDANDDNETDEIVVIPPQCADGIDNDNDTLIDLADAGCIDANDGNETDEIPPVVDLAPVVSIIAPADNTIFTGTNNITAQYIVTDDITQDMNCSVAVVDADGNFQLVGDVHNTMNNTVTSVDFTNVPNGVYVWNVLCIDELWNLGYNPLNFTVTVNYTQPVVNNAPVLGTIGSFVTYENSTLLFSVSATDADNDTLAYSVSGLPSGASFSNVTRTFIWTPDFTQSGNYTVTFLVTDGIASDSEAVQITVNDVNNGTGDDDDDDQGDDNDDQGSNGGSGGSSGNNDNGHGSNFDCPLNEYREDGRCVSAVGSNRPLPQPASPALKKSSLTPGDEDSLTAGILGGQGKDNGKVIEGDLKITGNAVAEPEAQADFGKTFFGIILLIAAIACILMGIYKLYAYRAERIRIVDIAQPSQNAF